MYYHKAHMKPLAGNKYVSHSASYHIPECNGEESKLSTNIALWVCWYHTLLNKGSLLTRVGKPGWSECEPECSSGTDR